MTIFESKNYVSYMQNAILSDGKKKHGIVKALAEKLRCHPTFISQVINGKADLNHDQAVRLCKYLEFTQEETEFFIDMLNRDRAASSEAKEHFQKILDRKISDRRVFQKRAKLKSSLRADQEGQYLSRWSCPVAHAAIQIPNLRTMEKLAKLLDIDEADAKQVLETLESLKLAKKVSGNWVPTETALHIGRDSPFAANFHANMRLKTAANLVSRKRRIEQTHFSSVFAISKTIAEEIREAFLQSLKAAREKMVDSDPEVLYVLCLDYYPLP
jgi:uncharacterized protein (TIGR02147 family)